MRDGVSPLRFKMKKLINNCLKPFNIQINKYRNIKTEPFILKGQLLKRILFVYDLLNKINNVEGKIIECGVGWGRSIAIFSMLIESDPKLKKREIIGFDSFEGFPQPTLEDNFKITGVKKGRYKTGLSYVNEFLSNSGLKNVNQRTSINLIKGFFEETLSKAKIDKIALLNLDGDLYLSYKTCLDILLDKVMNGGIIIFDEYESVKYPGCKKAVLEFFREKDIIKHHLYDRHFIIIKK